MTATLLRSRLDSILQFMEPHWSWANCHMVNYLTDQHWQNFVPRTLQEDLQSPNDVEECIESVFWSLKDNESKKFIHFKQFKEKAQQHSLHAFTDVITTKEAFEQHILGLDNTLKQQIKIKEFLTEKKRHEVEITACLVNDIILASPWKTDCFIVDAGDGKGYLSSRLALEYGHKILGIDSNTKNTENAMERSGKLKKAWNGLKERAELVAQGITPPRRGKVKQKDFQNQRNSLNTNVNYKTVDKFINSDMDLIDLLKQHFKETNISFTPSVCLTGLHTCGNLAATCLKLFHTQPAIKIMCNIGCCYHMLKEQFSSQEFFGNKQIEDLNKEIGFPLSKYLQEKQIKLGRNARMLAAQSIERTMNAKELPNISLYYRSMLELLIWEQRPDLKELVQVGKIRKFNNFQEYVDACSKKYPDLNICKKRIEEIENLAALRQDKKYLDLFYLLRMTFAPVLESLILLDRLLFLKELGYNQSFLIPVFDPVVSPRHFAIVTMKLDGI